MSTLSAAAILLLLTAAGYWAGRGRALALAASGPARLHSRPIYHGAWVALASALTGLLLLPLSPWLALAASAAVGAVALSRLSTGLRARPLVETVVRLLFAASSLIAILATIGIVLSLVFEAARFFERVPATEFLFGLHWSPQTAIRADQVGSSGAFGAVPVFAGTLLITVIAMAVAVPIGLLSAVYMSEYASRRARTVLKPMLEILAGIPTVVYGFFAALSVGPMIRALGERAGLDVASESALAAGLVMGVMIIPFVSSLSDDVINAVPQSLREGSLGLGATPSETIRRVVLPAALPGIVGAVLLAVSRAIGETMIVAIAAGQQPRLTWDPTVPVETMTAYIVQISLGDTPQGTLEYRTIFAVGMLLFIGTFGLNLVSVWLRERYREEYA
jgi:phosphate transport system permease protein